MKDVDDSDIVSSRAALRAIEVRPVEAHEVERWLAFMREHHYLGFGKSAGKRVLHVATIGGEWVALLCWAAAALHVKCRDQWIGWDGVAKTHRLRLVTNNTRFLVLPGWHLRNLASRVLGLSIRRLARDWQARHGYSVETMPDVQLGSERVSSSAVRAALERGDFARAGELLGRSYEISGRVAHGAKLGRKLGFPTANIPLAQRPPLAGIYVVEACRTDLGGPWEWLPGVASVGRRPTVNQVETPLLEVFLLDFGEEIYDRHLKVRFLQKLRDERKFADIEALRLAIAEDTRQAREYFLRAHRMS